jgi:methylated-DNA-[protein]-cysteine S-methyltransferase
LRNAIKQLGEYFEGKRKEFDIPISSAGTPFQQVVWEKLREIPYGETITYGELAQQIGDPDAARAVGTANGANPISVIIPCHRVIGGTGKLVGYAGGLWRKQWLLEHEASFTKGKQITMFL